MSACSEKGIFLKKIIDKPVERKLIILATLSEKL